MSEATKAKTETPKTFEEKFLELLASNPDFDVATVAKIASQKKNADNAKIKKAKIKIAKDLIEIYNISPNAIFPSKPWRKTSAETAVEVIIERTQNFKTWESGLPEDVLKALDFAVEIAQKALEARDNAVNAYHVVSKARHDAKMVSKDSGKAKTPPAPANAQKGL